MDDNAANLTAQGDVFGNRWEAPFRRASTGLERVIRANGRGFRAGATLKLEGDDNGAVYVVLSGWLAMSKSLANGARQIVDIVVPGGIIDPSSAQGDICAVQVETLSYARIAVVARAEWNRLCDVDASVRQFQAVTAAAALSRMSERMLRLGKASAESRIAYALIELCLRLSAIGGGSGNTYHLPLTQQRLGEYTGLSSVHVCRTIRRLTRGGLIDMSDHMDIVIHDIDVLACIADVDLEVLRRQIIVESTATVL